MTGPATLGHLTVRPAAPGRRHGEPITVGVPLPRGRVRDAATLVVTGEAALPTQAVVLDRWPDGSIRWVLVDTRAAVPAGGAVLLVRDDLAAPDVAAPVAVTLAPRRAAVTTGAMHIDLDLDRGQPFAGVTMGGRPVLDAARAAVHIVDASGAVLPVRYSAITADVVGPLRTVLAIDGEAGGLRVRLRLTVLAGLPQMGVALALHNPNAAAHPGGFWELGDPGSLRLREVALHLPLPGPAHGCRVSLEGGAPLHAVALPFAVTQHASGGEHWRSDVHVNATGAVTLEHPGYTTVAGGVSGAGRRATPLVVAEHAAGALWCTAQHFWEVFPKAIEVDAVGLVRVGCLPPGREPHELQGGERCDYEFWIGWGDDGVTAVPLDWRRAPSTALPGVTAVAETERLYGLEPATAAASPVYEQLVGAAVDGADTFLVKRERIDEYGWRHYGDLYADHENGAEPGRHIVSHYNNQYDPVHGLTVQALRHDDHRWWQQARDLARHVSRIDIYWTAHDRAAYNGGLFWHSAHYTPAGASTHRTYPRVAGLDGGGPSNEHCYSNGLLLHYFLTGDPVCRDAVLSLANWILAMDDGRLARFPLPWLSTAPTGAASATVSGDYHGPGRGPANAVVTLLNAHRLTGDERYVAKADELVRRVVHPEDDLEALGLRDPEHRWSYTVMLQALGKYLSTRHDLGRRDAHWDYARAVLLHYARWMADHEYLALEQPERLEFPTETWAAQDLRKVEVLDLAAHHAGTAGERERLLAAAADFHRRALAMLAALPTRTRTRPLVLLLSYGYAHPWFARHVPSAPLEAAPAGPWPAPSRFVPQRAIAVRRLKRLVAGGAVAAGAAATALLRWLF